jgi:hypothetical protein
VSRSNRIVNGNHYMSDLRVTKGVGRYTSNFTVPAAAFSSENPNLLFKHWLANGVPISTEPMVTVKMDYNQTLRAVYGLKKPTETDLNAGLVAYYPFNGNANDGSGNGNDGEVIGATLGNDRYGNSNSAYEFNGVNNYIDLTNADFTISGRKPRSIFGWIKTAKKTNTLVSLGTASPNNAFTLGNINGNGVLSVMGYSNDFYPREGIKYYDGKWNFIGVTYDALGNITTYVNSKLDNVGYITLNTSGNNNYIGVNNHSFTHQTKGSIDDVRIYSRALSGAEVAALYELDKLEEPPPTLPTYQIIEGNYTWHEAKADAEARGGHLATITSQEESDTVGAIVAVGNKSPWLGGTDEGREGQWRWITGEVWDYSNWYYGEPNDMGGEHFLQMTPTKQGVLKWNDAGRGNYRTSYILEIPKHGPIELMNPNTTVHPFTFTFIAKVNSTYEVQVSQDLKDWSKLGEVKGKSGEVEFTDPRLPKVPFKRNYFRVKLVE